MARFEMREPRYIRQRGQSEPAYVYADPDHPAIVDLPDDTTPDKRLVPVVDEVKAPEPQNLIPAHAVTPRPDIPSAAKLQGPKPKRAADS